MTLLQALFLYIVSPIVSFLIFLIWVHVILGWLIQFNIVNGYNQFVSMVGDITNRVVEPMLRPIRNMIPSLGGIDFSPFILMLALIFTRNWLLAGLVFGNLRIF